MSKKNIFFLVISLLCFSGLKSADKEECYASRGSASSKDWDAISSDELAAAVGGDLESFARIERGGIATMSDLTRAQCEGAAVLKRVRIRFDSGKYGPHTATRYFVPAAVAYKIREGSSDGVRGAFR